MSPPGPPRAIARALEAILPPTERAAAMIGDLHEEFGRRAARGERWVTLWYAREAVGVAVRYLGRARRYERRRGRLARTDGTTWEGRVDRAALNVRYALRRLLKNPAFTGVAILSLGLGIGANSAMFSLVHAVVFRDRPFRHPETLVDGYLRSEGFSHGTLSYPDYVDLAEGSSEVFDEVGGSQFMMLQTDVEGGIEVVPGEAVTGNYFHLLGIEAAVGRLISAEDHVAPGAHPVAVLGYGYWTRRFAADPDVVGREIRLSGRPYTIVGVAPEAFSGSLRGVEPGVFVPIMQYDQLEGRTTSVLELRGNQSFFAKARLAPGATFSRAEAVAGRISETLREDDPEDWPSTKAFVILPTMDVIMNPMIDRFIVTASGLVMAVVGLVLLIACANLASFLLARAADRRKEIAVRLAIGATRRTLVGQLLTETILLSLIGGGVGVALATWSLRLLTAVDLPLPIPITLDLSLDASVLGFNVAVSLLAGILFGLAPALQSTNPDVAPTLRDESAGGGRSRGAALRDLLVVGQVAVSVVLLIAGGLFLRSLEASRSIDPGFGHAPTGILQMNVAADRYTEEEGRRFLAELGDRIRALPGVRAVGHIDNMPLDPLNTQTSRVEVDGVATPEGQDFHLVDLARIDDRFFDAAGVSLVAGRGFGPADETDGDPVAIVNEEFVRRFFAGQGAVGRSITVEGRETRVVGVATNHKVRQLGEDPRPYVYLDYEQSYSPYVAQLARTSGDPGRLALDMVSIARSIDPDLMLVEAETMQRHLAVMLIGRELGALVVSGFAALALLLASIGLYGVVSYAVSRRVKEVGIRLSLGADAGAVVRMLTGGGMKLVGIGAALGLLVAAALSQLLSRLLYGVPPLDPVTFVAVPLVLATVALAAAWIPARRVTRIDPVGALRAE